MKYLFCIVALLMAVLAGATVPATAADILTRNWADSLQITTPLCLQVEAGAESEAVDAAFKEALIKRGAVLYDQPTPECTVVHIGLMAHPQTRTTTGLLTGKTIKYTDYTASLQLTNSGTGLISGYKTLQFTMDSAQDDTPGRWYDSFVVSVIIGSLVYLFYYGSI